MNKHLVVRSIIILTVSGLVIFNSVPEAAAQTVNNNPVPPEDGTVAITNFPIPDERGVVRHSTIVAGPTTSIGQQIKNQFQEDLKELGKLKFKDVSPNHLKWFGKEDSSGVVEYLNARIKVIIPTANRQTGPGIFADAWADDYHRGVYYLTPMHSQHSLAVRLMNLVHEAKHAEADRGHHVACAAPFIFRLKGYEARIAQLDALGSGSCDHDDNGAYAIAYTFAMSLVNSCTNCSKEMKKEAFSAALTRGLTRIRDEEAANRLFDQSNIDVEKENSMIPIYMDALRNARSQ